VWTTFPQLSALVFAVSGVDQIPAASVDERAKELLVGVAEDQAKIGEADRPSIKAWRQAYSTMGLKPTKYRSAVEALLRRFRKDGTMPQLHPIVNLLNAYSMSAGLPIAVFDTDHIADGIEVRPAKGIEKFTTFSGDVEQPEPNEIVFADSADTAHARRWVYRQSAVSSMSKTSKQALVVIEGLHETVSQDLEALRDQLVPNLNELGASVKAPVILGPDQRSYTFDGQAAVSDPI
ncbi:MAG: phenylalanine--tRNA ligase beta subunit-related protein, partial [Pseudomonadota bacterium]